MKNKFLDYLLFPYIFLVIYFVYRTSQSLPPFHDEVVSLSANIGFFLNNLNFEGPKGTIYEGLYSPFLSSPPLSAVGSAVGWIFTENLNLIRLSNFIYIALVQVILGYFISKIYDLKFKKVIYFSIFSLISFPFWFGSIYSLGETISIVLFFNAILLYKYYPKTSMLMMGSVLFFGKLITGVLFIFFYLSNLFVTKKIKKVPIEIFTYLLPSAVWISIVMLKSDYKDLQEYVAHFIIWWEYISGTVGNLNLLESINYENIYSNFQDSEVQNWNLSVKLRVFLPPIFLFFLLIIKKGSKMMLTFNQLITLFFGLAPIFGWYVFLAKEKPVLYTSYFTFSVLMFCCYLLSRKKLEIDIVNNIAFFIVCLYMTSEILFVIGVILLILINFDNKFNYGIIVPLILISLINSTFEISGEYKYNFDLSECNNEISSNYCWQYLINIQK